MGKKRKSDATRLDEVDQNMNSTFCSAANHLSQLYTQAMNQQKLAFQAGERHGMEKLYQWILKQHEEGSRVTAADIVAYLQNGIHHGGEDAAMSPRLQSQHQPTTHFMNSSVQTSSACLGQAAVVHSTQHGNSDQNKLSVFSNALSSPIRQSLQPYHVAQCGGYHQSNILSTGNGGGRYNEVSSPRQNRETNSSNDSAMDMHDSDSPAPGSY